MKDLDAILPPCPDSPNCVRLAVEVPSDSITTLQTVKIALQELDAYSVSHDSSSNRIDAVFRIPVFGWKDDVIAIVEQGELENRSVLYLRSASRIGYYDLGVNKRRVRKIARKIKNIINN